jgi:hypothetical protein
MNTTLLPPDYDIDPRMNKPVYLRLVKRELLTYKDRIVGIFAVPDWDDPEHYDAVYSLDARTGEMEYVGSRRIAEHVPGAKTAALTEKERHVRRQLLRRLLGVE